MMPVYEYFCPQCSRELEVLRPIQSASDQSECPHCGGKAWRLVSGFGSKTGSYLQPAGMPFRVEAGWPLSERDKAAVATQNARGAAPLYEDAEALAAFDLSWLLEWQPNGSNVWFIRDWGVASVLRYLREYLGIEPSEETPALEDVMGTTPAEEPIGVEPGVDQQAEHPSVRPRSGEWTQEPPKATKPDAGLAGEPMVASKAPWFGGQAKRSEVVTGTQPPALSQEGSTLPPRWLPTSYYGRLMLLAACTAAIVVTVVWVLATAA